MKFMDCVLSLLQCLCGWLPALFHFLCSSSSFNSSSWVEHHIEVGLYCTVCQYHFWNNSYQYWQFLPDNMSHKLVTVAMFYAFQMLMSASIIFYFQIKKRRRRRDEATSQLALPSTNLTVDDSDLIISLI